MLLQAVEWSQRLGEKHEAEALSELRVYPYLYGMHRSSLHRATRLTRGDIDVVPVSLSLEDNQGLDPFVTTREAAATVPIGITLTAYDGGLRGTDDVTGPDV